MASSLAPTLTLLASPKPTTKTNLSMPHLTVWQTGKSLRMVSVASSPSTPPSISEKVSDSIKKAEEACADTNPQSGECVAAWDEVEELSAAASHARDKLKGSDPLEKYRKSGKSLRMVSVASSPSTPPSISEKVSDSIKKAEEACADTNPQSGECVAAWDEVEELSAAASHARDKLNGSDPL